MFLAVLTYAASDLPEKEVNSASLKKTIAQK